MTKTEVRQSKRSIQVYDAKTALAALKEDLRRTPNEKVFEQTLVHADGVNVDIILVEDFKLGEAELAKIGRNFVLKYITPGDMRLELNIKLKPDIVERSNGLLRGSRLVH